MTERLARAQAEREQRGKKSCDGDCALAGICTRAVPDDGAGGTAAARSRQAARKSTPGHSLATFQRPIAMCCEIAADRDRDIGYRTDLFCACSQGIMDRTFANWRRCVTLLARTSNLDGMCNLLFAGRRHGGVPARRAAARGRHAGSAASAADTDRRSMTRCCARRMTCFRKPTCLRATTKIELVVDPLIDGISGAQSTATRLMQDRIVALVKKSYPRFEVRPFSTEALSRAPVVLIGTFTAINNAGAADGPRDAYRICLALADLRSKSIVSKGVARAKPEAIDVTPTPGVRGHPGLGDRSGHQPLHQGLPRHQTWRPHRSDLRRADRYVVADQRRNPRIR